MRSARSVARTNGVDGGPNRRRILGVVEFCGRGLLYGVEGISSPTDDAWSGWGIGYSQGGHIAGDLAQTILHESKPFGQDNLGGVLLFGDPAFNGASPNTLGLDYRAPLDDGEPYTALSLEKTAVMEGSVGQRAEFDENAPVLSVCLHGDLICDLTAESAAADPTTHQAYTAKFAEASTPMSAAEWSALVLHDIIENGEK
ncbi:cutinase family protein [Rhodococcus rhodochrous]|uniref:cutinase family protein n=1 Tax=Rhodococcus rhodochrous TaxID=1829 RepID=UPI001E3A5A43|nr:cutinase family protein [Rhodococcus rhodochrous]MCB8913378.1 cutinase family protein [Rhodococcus rhodochrous]